MTMSPLTHKNRPLSLAVLLICLVMFFSLSDLPGNGSSCDKPSQISAVYETVIDASEQGSGKNTVFAGACLQALPVLITSRHSRIEAESLETQNSIPGTYRCYPFRAPPR